MANMTPAMFALVKQQAARVIREAADAVDYAIHTNRAGTTIPTQSITRVFRTAVAGQTTRAFTVVVSLTEIASGSVAAASPAATDDAAT